LPGNFCSFLKNYKFILLWIIRKVS
jgi:hypothetical protein